MNKNSETRLHANLVIFGGFSEINIRGKITNLRLEYRSTLSLIEQKYCLT